MWMVADNFCVRPQRPHFIPSALHIPGGWSHGCPPPSTAIPHLSTGSSTGVERDPQTAGDGAHRAGATFPPVIHSVIHRQRDRAGRRHGDARGSDDGRTRATGEASYRHWRPLFHTNGLFIHEWRGSPLRCRRLVAHCVTPTSASDDAAGHMAARSDARTASELSTFAWTSRIVMWMTGVRFLR